MSSSELTLGAAVEFSHVISREVGWIDGKGKTKIWREFAAPGTGFVVGWRTLSNGHVEKIIESDGYYGGVHVDNQWIASEYFKAYIITTDLRMTPSWVLPDKLRMRDE